MGSTNGRTTGRARRFPAALAMGTVLLACACGPDARHPTDAARAHPPGAPSRVQNPLCNSFGQLHSNDSIAGAVTWSTSGNPHRVFGTVALLPGGTLTLQPGVVVCFDAAARVHSTGGRLVARGLPASPIVLTAWDPGLGWRGIDLQGTPPSSGSQIIYARVEYVAVAYTAISSTGHLVFIDSAIVRQSGSGVRLTGANSRFARSRVDTTTNRNAAAITLGDNSRVAEFVIRRSAGTGLLVEGTTGVRVLGGHIEASRGVGIRAPQMAGIASASLVRVVGGNSYPLEATIPNFLALYGSTVNSQDQLKGNARDTVVVLGGTLRSTLYVRNGLPWHVTATIIVDSAGLLGAQSSTGMVLDPEVGLVASNGGRLMLRGTRTAPVVLTADDPALGWDGIILGGDPGTPSYITNARVEHVAYAKTAILAAEAHAVRVDSVVLRQNGSAAALLSPGSRLTRSRVDSTLSSFTPAVQLGEDAILESTLIRGASSYGVTIHSAAVQVQSCEVREGASHGIFMQAAVPVHNCNLVDNLGAGVWNDVSATADVTGNWWGDPAGPNGPAGDGAAGPVNFTPWLTTPFVLPYVP